MHLNPWSFVNVTIDTSPRNMSSTPKPVNSIRQGLRSQLINRTITSNADSSSTLVMDGHTSRKEITAGAPVMPACVSSPRRSPRLKVIPNYCERGVGRNPSPRFSMKRKAEEEIVGESTRDKTVRHRSNRKRIVRTDVENSDSKGRYRNDICPAGSEVKKKRLSLKRSGERESNDVDVSEIDRLPVEVLSYIFKFLEPCDRKIARLVCSKWYHSCQNERIKINSKCSKPKETERMPDIRKCLENCQFRQLNLSLEAVVVNKLSAASWRKFGSKVKSLECPLTTRATEHIIKCCKNLQHLHLIVSPSLPEGLSKLLTKLSADVVNRELQTLEVNLRDEVAPLNASSLNDWRSSFEAIYRIFPNIKNFAFSRYHFRNTGSIKYKCKFSRAHSTCDQGEDSSLALVFADLAFSILSGDDWVKSLENLSVVRLINFELIFCKKTYTSDDRIHLQNFIGSQKYLRSVRMDFSSWISAEMLSSVLLGIVENCFDLDELSYNVPYHKHYLTPSECTTLLQKMARIKSVSIGGFSITSSTSVSLTLPNLKVSKLEMSSVDEMICMRFIRNYTCLRHLVLKKFITDDVLQCIFHYLTELEALDIQLDHACTNFGITGRRGAVESGYSISRLQSLRQLTINFERAKSVDDRVFSRFNFPHLLYLHCSKDQIRFKYVMALAPKLPLLEEIRFKSEDMSLKSLQKFCSKMKNLFHLHTNLEKFANKLARIFEVCPRLRMITNVSTNFVHHYSPISRKIVRKNVH